MVNSGGGTTRSIARKETNPRFAWNTVGCDLWYVRDGDEESYVEFVLESPLKS